MAMRFLPLGCLFLVSALLISGAPRVAAQNEVYPHSSPQIRMEGQVRGLSPDGKSVEVDVAATTAPSGRRVVFTALSPRQIRIHEACFIYDRNDPTRFYTPQELKPGTVVVVVAVEGADQSLVTGEIQLGGTLPKLAPAPVETPGGQPISLPPISSGLAKFEPVRGCYLGAFVMRDEHVDGSMATWEKTVGKGHASYLRYVGYGRPFPKEWVKEVRTLGAVPNLAFEPNGGLAEVRDNAYLRQFARDARASGGPVFMRFASEMNGPWTAYSGNPRLYREKFRLVTRVMRQEAPNVAMVWTPYCTPARPIPDYYPGDDAVDWVGINIYSVHHHDGRIDRPAAHEDPLEFLKPIYERYAKKKPIQISEYAATNYCLACEQSMPQFAAQKMKRLYASLPTRFPRVKMIYWFSWDTIAGKAAENNYSVVGDPAVLLSYQETTRSSYFLPRLVSAPARKAPASGMKKEAAVPVRPRRNP